jgi:hypothetical protein
MKIVHWIQVGLACVAASAVAFGQSAPQYNPQAMIVAGACTALLTGLGVVSPSAIGTTTKTETTKVVT